jgi:predicted nucleic acid-binding Zn ribbon protein
MEQIGNIIGKRLNHHQISESARASAVVYKANQYLSTWLKCEKEDARATSLKDGILWIGTGNSAWSQEAQGVSSPLLKKLQDEYGKTYVKKVRIRSLNMR